MPTEVLSQTEIDSLFSAFSANNAGAAEPEPLGPDAIEDFRPASDADRIKPHDFTITGIFSREQLRFVNTIGETFAQLFTEKFSGLLDKEVEVRLASVDSLCYKEFIISLPNQTHLALICMNPLKGNALFEIDPYISEAFFNSPLKSRIKGIIRLLTGGNPKDLNYLFKQILPLLRKSWKGVLNLHPKLETIKTNPRYFQIVYPREQCILLTFDCRIGDVEGMLNFCIPHSTIKPALPPFSADKNCCPKTNKGEKLKPPSLNDALDSVCLTISVELGRSSQDLKTIKGFKKGYVVELDALCNEPLNVYVNNVLIAKAEAVIINENNFGIRLTEITGETDKPEIKHEDKQKPVSRNTRRKPKNVRRKCSNPGNGYL
jgi:flagellar motor switch protein FliM